MQAVRASQIPSSGAVSLSVPDAEHPPPSELAFEVLDFSPEWDWPCGSTKLLLTGSILASTHPDTAHLPLFIMFDGTQVWGSPNIEVGRASGSEGPPVESHVPVPKLRTCNGCLSRMRHPSEHLVIGSRQRI